MLSAIMLIAVSCSKSKEEPKDETPKACLVSEVVNGNNKDDKQAYAYDESGNVLTYIYAGEGLKETYTYTSSSITKKHEQSPVSYTEVFTLDAQGRVKSSSWTSTDVANSNYTASYTYDNDGYLIEKKTTHYDNTTSTQKCTWTNGNLTKIEDFYNGSSTPNIVFTYQYSADILPSNFLIVGILDVGLYDTHISKFFGKQPKNLPAYDGATYTFTKDVNGNIIKFVSEYKYNGSDYVNITEYKYNCK